MVDGALVALEERLESPPTFSLPSPVLSEAAPMLGFAVGEVDCAWVVARRREASRMLKKRIVAGCVWCGSWSHETMVEVVEEGEDEGWE